MLLNERDIQAVAFLYSVYGLYLHSNQSIPGLVAIKTAPGVDVQVGLGLIPPWLQERIDLKQKVWYKSRHLDESGQPIMRAWKLSEGAYLRLVYCDRTEFIINQAGTQIWATWPEELTLEDTATYLLGPILGFVLRLRGIICLHASAVVIDNRAIALLGAAGAGKSTTAAAFAQAGFAVLSDDVVALWDRERQFLVQPAYPRVRLWPASVKALYGESDALPCLTPNWDKRYLDLNQTGYQFQPSPLPLGAVYILSDRITSPSAPFIQPIPTHQGLITLIANTYANTLLDKTMRAQEFDLLSRVAAKVPLRQVIPHTDAAYLPKLCQVILEDFQQIGLFR